MDPATRQDELPAKEELPASPDGATPATPPELIPTPA
jgi:hypothetical protein